MIPTKEKIVELLTCADEKLTEATWIKDVLALDAEGYEHDETAILKAREYDEPIEIVQFCSIGAVYMCDLSDYKSLTDATLACLRDSARILANEDETYIPNWNDRTATTLDDVHDMFALAIMLAEEKEAE